MMIVDRRRKFELGNANPGRCVAALFAVVVAAGACVQEAPAAQTGAPNPSAQNTAPATRPITIEFDVPDGFAGTPGSQNAVTGFRVGYFRGNDPATVGTTDVPRSAVVVRGRTARIILRDVPVGLQGGVIRVQTLSGDRASAWSDPVPLDGLRPAGRSQAAPQQGRSGTARPEAPGRAQPRRAPRGLGLAELERHPALADALRKLLPPDTNLEPQVANFGRIDQLALAVVISRDYEVPFVKLSQVIAGPPRINPRDALASLRKDLNIRDVLRKARPEVRRFVQEGQPAGDTAR